VSPGWLRPHRRIYDIVIKVECQLRSDVSDRGVAMLYAVFGSLRFGFGFG
jgi:hypothetical protein